MGNNYSYDKKSGTLTVDKLLNGKRNEKGKLEFPWDKYKNEVKKIIINHPITEIPESAFADCWNLTSIEMPKSVTSIENKAFMNCYHLYDINIPETCTVATNAFSNCFTLDLIKVIEVFCPLNSKDNNIQLHIANILYFLNSNRFEYLPEIFLCIKQIYSIMNIKEDFVILLKRFLHVLFSFKKDCESAKTKFQFIQLYKEINTTNIYEKYFNINSNFDCFMNCRN